jgi:diguanylate cyclase (GGDEF)-like protein
VAHNSNFERLAQLLREVGVRTVDDRSLDGRSGFVVDVPFEGGTILLDLPHPGPIASLGSDSVGVAVVDSFGYVKLAWGLAERISYLRPSTCLLETPIGPLLDIEPGHSGGAMYFEGNRYFSGRVSLPGGDDRMVLVTAAREEGQVRKLASKSGRMAGALKRLGKALTMHQTMDDLCISSSHEIASAMELAAVLIWMVEPEDGCLRLAASVGVNRMGTGSLNRLRASEGAGCAAELVADTCQTFYVGNVVEHVLTTHLEAKFSYLKPGGVTVHPLVISDRLLGVLEMVGREGDPHFADSGELHQTVAEHLALALNSAAMFENLERLASHDPLTGLANHRALQEYLQQRAAEADRTGQGLGAIMIDVDHFRSFNEEEGHDAGDAVLRQVAEAIKGCLREYDLGARYGGEEFSVVMPGSSELGIETAAERIRSRVEAMPFVTRSGRERHLTVSLGCALFPNNASDGPSLLKAADLALFEAKRSGRNRVVRFRGTAASHTPQSPLSLDSVRGLVPEGAQAAADGRLIRFADEITWLADRLHLSSSQRIILQALLIVAPAYLDAWQNERRPELDKIESSEEARLLLPSLRALADPKSAARVPLLAKVVEVLLALEGDGGRSLAELPSRFDAEIVSLIWEYGRAA